MCQCFQLVRKAAHVRLESYAKSRLPLAQGRFILYNMFFGENSFCKEGA